MGIKILFLLPYPVGCAPSQRFRVEMLLPLLKDEGLEYKLKPFLDQKTGNILYKNGSGFKKILGILNGFISRIMTVVFQVPGYDFIFIHREASPLGPPIFEWYISKVLRKCIIYDFDDSIWIPDSFEKKNFLKALKWQRKVGLICKWSSVISAGNEYLCAYAREHSSARIVLVPTVVDTANRYNLSKKTDLGRPLIVGWTGSHSTLKYLDDVLGVIRRMQDEFSFKFVVIADKEPALTLKNWEFIQWNPDSEIQDLLKFDIGIMPLKNDLWAEGKCGFKVIQYLALGIPAVASQVGVNKKIIEHGINGYLCSSDDEWYAGIKSLLLNDKLRSGMGKKGMQKIRAEFSVSAVKTTFLSLFGNSISVN